MASDLVLRLKAVPRHFHAFLRIGDDEFSMLPVGEWTHAAATEIERLRSLLAVSRANEEELRKALETIEVLP